MTKLKIRRTFNLATISLFMLITCSSVYTQQKSSPPPPYERVVVADKGFSIVLPTNWTFARSRNPDQITTCPPQAGGSKMKKCLTISPEIFPKLIPLNQYYKLTINRTKKLFHEFKLLTSLKTKLARKNAIEFVGKVDNGEQLIGYVMVNRTHGYAFIYAATPKQLKKLQPTLSHIIESLKMH